MPITISANIKEPGKFDIKLTNLTWDQVAGLVNANQTLVATLGPVSATPPYDYYAPGLLPGVDIDLKRRIGQSLETGNLSQFQNNRLVAIKHVKELTGAGLKDSKDFVDWVLLHQTKRY